MKIAKAARAAGYTLIEIAIVIGVVGMILATAVTAWRIYMMQQAHDTTLNNISDVTSALEKYMARNGAYPCPASPNAGRLDADYGIAPDTCASAAGDEGTCNADGFCIEVTQRTDTPGLFVRRGAVPFRVLNLTEGQSLDGYGQRLQYVVTEQLTDSATFTGDGGGISIVDSADRDAYDPQGHAKFIVFSSGADKKGAYNKDGIQAIPCNANDGKDRQNCNTMDDEQAVYRAGQFAEAAGAAHFDDYVQFYSAETMPIWKTVGNGDHITDMVGADLAGKMSLRMPPYTPNPTDLTDKAYTLEISGNVRASEKLKAGLLCDGAGKNCFRPEKISGYDAVNMRCQNPGECVKVVWSGLNPDGTPIGGKAECMPSDFCGGAFCREGWFVKEVRADGTLRCGPPPNTDCPSITPVACQWDGVPVRKTLPVGKKGDVFEFHMNAGDDGDPTPEIPDDYQGIDYYTCTGGAWTLTNSDWPPNACALPTPPVCEPDGGTGQTATCREWYCHDNPFFPGGSDTYCINGTMSGNVVFDWQRTCPGDVITISNFNNAQCQCTPTTESASFGCDPGFSGTRTWSRNWTCSGPLQGQWSDWAETVNTCQCIARAPETETQPCGFGYSGNKTRTRTWSCSSATQGAWSAWSNWSMAACTCSTQTDRQQLSCPVGYNPTGSIQQERHIDCTSGSPVLTNWTTTSNTCGACDPNRPGTTETRYISCASQFPNTVGNIPETRSLICPDSWTPWSSPNPPNTYCTAGTYHWAQGGSVDPTVYSTKPPVPLVGDACSPGQTGACTRLVGSGYKKYPGCVCAND